MKVLETKPEVVDYLRRLDVALARLPRDEAGELRAQIVEHLEDALDPETTTNDVAAVLDRLGPPEELVAETIGGKPRRLWPWIRARHWWTWAIVVVILAGIGSGIGYTVNMATQPALQGGCQPCGWFYPGDFKNAHDIDNIAGDEWVTPIRPGQLQGFVVTLSNPSSRPERIVGVDPNTTNSIGGPTPPTVSISPADPERGGDFRHTQWAALPVTIQPGQYRFIRVTWRSSACFIDKGGTEGTSALSLRVRIGWFTHTQLLTFPETFAVAGKPFPATCPGGARP